MMIWRLARGICSVTAATTGLLLAYGITFAMEGMTNRIRTSSVHEFATTTLWMVPWTLLFCAGLEDFVIATRRAWLFWVGLAPAIAFLFYFERYTTASLLTESLMPMFSIFLGLLPHAFRQISIVFSLLPLLAGIAGLVALYYTLPSFLTFSFATRAIGVVIVVFEIASLCTCLLSVALLPRRNAQPVSGT